MHIEDCLDAMFSVIERADRPMNAFDLGTRTTSVNRFVDVVSEELGLEPAYEYTDGERGWTGDVSKMRLSIEKLSGFGEDVELENDQAGRETGPELIAEMA